MASMFRTPRMPLGVKDENARGASAPPGRSPCGGDSAPSSNKKRKSVDCAVPAIPDKENPQPKRVSVVETTLSTVPRKDQSHPDEPATTPAPERGTCDTPAPDERPNDPTTPSKSGPNQQEGPWDHPWDHPLEKFDLLEGLFDEAAVDNVAVLGEFKVALKHGTDCARDPSRLIEMCNNKKYTSIFGSVDATSLKNNFKILSHKMKKAIRDAFNDRKLIHQDAIEHEKTGGGSQVFANATEILDFYDKCVKEAGNEPPGRNKMVRLSECDPSTQARAVREALEGCGVVSIRDDATEKKFLDAYHSHLKPLYRAMTRK